MEFFLRTGRGFAFNRPRHDGRRNEADYRRYFGADLQCFDTDLQCLGIEQRPLYYGLFHYVQYGPQGTVEIMVGTPTVRVGALIFWA